MRRALLFLFYLAFGVLTPKLLFLWLLIAAFINDAIVFGYRPIDFAKIRVLLRQKAKGVDVRDQT